MNSPSSLSPCECSIKLIRGQFRPTVSAAVTHGTLERSRMRIVLIWRSRAEVHGDTWLAASGTVRSRTCLSKSSCETLNCRPCTPKGRQISATDIPAISIPNTLSGSFPFRPGLVAFVHVEELTSVLYGQDQQPMKQRKNFRKNHPRHVSDVFFCVCVKCGRQ